MNSILRLSIYLILSITPFTFALADKPITIITEEWPPYNYFENNKLTGFSTEVIQLVMKDLNINERINVFPGPRGMKILNNTKRAMFFSFIQTSDRKPNFKWIGPFGEQSIYFYKKKGSHLKIKTLDDAKKVRSICTRESGLVFNMLKAEGFKNLDVGVTPESIYLRAINDRCELAIGETPLGVHYWLKKTNNPIDALEQTSLKLISSPLYIVTSKDFPDEEVLKWQKSLDKIKATNEYLKLQMKYSK